LLMPKPVTLAMLTSDNILLYPCTAAVMLFEVTCKNATSIGGIFVLNSLYSLKSSNIVGYITQMSAMRALKASPADAARLLRLSQMCVFILMKLRLRTLIFNRQPKKCSLIQYLYNFAD